MPKHAQYKEIKIYDPLTDEEKEEVLNKHHDFMRRLNTYLQIHGEKELDADKARKDLIAKLNDPQEVQKYRLCQQIEANEKKQKELSRELSKKYPLPKGETDYLSRSLHFLLKIEDTDEAREYNENIYKDYQKDPKAFAYARYKNLLNYDATKIAEMEGDEIAQLKWLKDNPAIAHEANEFGNPIDPTGAEGKAFGTSKIFGDNLKSLRGIYQKLNYPGSYIYTKYKNLDHLAIPDELDQKLAYDIKFQTSKYLEKGYKLSPGMSNALSEKGGIYNGTHSLNEYIDKLKSVGIQPTPDMFMKYYAVKVDPQTGKHEQVSIDDFIEGKQNVTVVERSQSTIDRIKYLNKDFELKYNFEFQKRMGFSIQGGDGSYNIFKVLKDNRSGFFARDSKEYKEFAQALADFTNPEKPGYLDKTKLRDKTAAYLQHTQEVKPGKNETDPVRRGRIQLANSVNNVLDQMDREHVEAKIGNEMVKGARKALDIPKEPAFDDDSISEIQDESLVYEGPLNKDESFFVRVEKPKIEEDWVYIDDNYIGKDD